MPRRVENRPGQDSTKLSVNFSVTFLKSLAHMASAVKLKHPTLTRTVALG